MSLIKSNKWSTTTLMLLITLWSSHVWSAAGLWPNSAFNEPKVKAEKQEPKDYSPELLFSSKTNRLQCFQQPSEDSFYVLSTGGKDFPKAKLSLYQLQPFALQRTVELPSLPMPFGRYEDSIVLPVKNSSKVIIYNVKSLMLFDFDKQALLHKVDFGTFSKGVVLNDNQVTVFFKNPMNRSQNRFKVFNADTLQVISETENSSKEFGSKYRGNSYSWFSSLAGNLVEIPRDMARDPQMVFYDKQTLKPRLIINHRDRQRDAMSNQTFYHVMPDFSKLYITTLYDHRSQMDFTASGKEQAGVGIDDNFHIEVDLKTQKLNLEVSHIPDKAIEMPLGHIYYQGHSETQRFVWIDGVHLIDKQENKIYVFHQFDDGEALLQDGVSQKIIMTKQAAKHLKIAGYNGIKQVDNAETLEPFLIHELMK